MYFSLSKESRVLLQQSTGLNNMQLTTTPISQITAKNNSDYRVRSKREIKPRGSILLRMGRLMVLSKVKSYLKGV
jgi:hypothetical protein